MRQLCAEDIINQSKECVGVLLVLCVVSLTHSLTHIQTLFLNIRGTRNTKLVS